MHTIPDALVQPRLDVGVVESEDGDLDLVFLQDGINREIRLAVVVADGVASEKRYAVAFDLLRDAVIDRMSRLYIMVAPDDGVVIHVVDHARKNVRNTCLHVVEVIRSVVALQEIACVKQDDVFPADGGAHAVHIVVRGQHGVLGTAVYIGGIEVGPVYVVGGQDMERVVSVPGTAACGCQQGGEYEPQCFVHVSIGFSCRLG